MKDILFSAYFLVSVFSSCLVTLSISSCKPQPTSTSRNPSPTIAQTSPTQPPVTVKILPLSPQTPSPAPVPTQATVSVQPQQPSPTKPNSSPSPQPTASVKIQPPSPAPTKPSPSPSPSPAKPSPSPSPSPQPTASASPSPQPTAPASPSPQPTASASPSIPCEFSAYVIDEDPKGLNVRREPGSNKKIIGNLPTQTEGVMVDITACQGEWVQITNAVSDGGNKIEFQGKGWVYASLLGATTSGQETNGTSLYAQADKNSKILSKLPPNRTVKLLGGSGTWMQVEYEGMRGWLAQYDYCPLPWTSCS